MQRKKSKVVPNNRVTHPGTFEGTRRRGLKTRSALKSFSVSLGVVEPSTMCLAGYLSLSALFGHSAIAGASKDL